MKRVVDAVVQYIGGACLKRDRREQAEGKKRGGGGGERVRVLFVTKANTKNKIFSSSSFVPSIDSRSVHGAPSIMTDNLSESRPKNFPVTSMGVLPYVGSTLGTIVSTFGGRNSYVLAADFTEEISSIVTITSATPAEKKEKEHNTLFSVIVST
jgi:hypothetical protein